MSRSTRVIQVDATRPDAGAIAEAAAVLRAGGLVAFPTETVYGLGANALDATAVAGIFEAKRRPATDPVIVHIAHIGQLGLFAADVPDAARVLGLAFWAGPLTLIVRKRALIADSITAGLATVGVRVPAHRVARALMEVAGVPVAAPSANRFSHPSPTRAEHVLADLDGRIDLLLDGGPTTIGVESTIVDVTVEPPVLRRPGGITLEQLRDVLPGIVVDERFASVERAQAAPGQLLRHYAPSAVLTLFEGAERAVVDRLEREVRASAGSGLRVGLLAPEEDLMALAPRLAALAATGRVITRAYGARREPERSARELFHALRALDADGPDVILAVASDPSGIGLAVRDRLLRAAEGRLVRV